MLPEFIYFWLIKMKSIADLIEKRYSDIPYPGGKSDRATLLRDITNTDVDCLEVKTRCAQVIIDIFGDQVALYESLDGDDKSQILGWVVKNWHESDIEYVDLLVTITANIEPNSAREFLSEKLSKTSDVEVKGILEDGLSEI